MICVQRVLNDLQRAKPTPLLPLLPSGLSKLDRRHTGRLTKRDKLLTGERDGEGFIKTTFIVVTYL
jgi:hypothetical protein